EHAGRGGVPDGLQIGARPGSGRLVTRGRRGAGQPDQRARALRREPQCTGELDFGLSWAPRLQQDLPQQLVRRLHGHGWTELERHRVFDRSGVAQYGDGPTRVPTRLQHRTTELLLQDGGNWVASGRRSSPPVPLSVPERGNEGDDVRQLPLGGRAITALQRAEALQ